MGGGLLFFGGTGDCEARPDNYLLSQSNSIPMMKSKPNLFCFATRELSQDAILCWLLSWADPRNAEHSPELHQVGVDLVSLLQAKPGVILEPPSSVRVLRQVERIDILCFVNHDTVLLIEDKVGTTDHSNQLARYKELVAEHPEHSREKIVPVYIQTGDQSGYAEAQKHGYAVVKRVDLLGVLEGERGQAARKASDTLEDFGSYLRHIENDVQSFLHKPPGEWSSRAWRGFFTRLQQDFGDADWRYIANPSGGFMGFWWHFAPSPDCRAYLQLEEDSLCFKIEVADEKEGQRPALRRHWSEMIQVHSPAHGLPTRRPDRFGNGRWMTVAVLDEEFPKTASTGTLDLAATISVLRAAEAVLDDCAARASKEPPPVASEV